METEDSQTNLIIDEEDIALYARFARGVFTILLILMNIVQILVSIVVFIGQRLGDEIVATEHMFLLMSNLYAFMCQFFFFTLCDITLLRPENKHKRGKVISGLTTLLLYSIFTYFAAKIRDTFTHVLERYTRSGTVRTNVLRTMKVMVEFLKAAIVILCLREQDAIIYGSKMLSLERFDGLEHLYIPIILHTISIILTIMILAVLLSMQRYTIYAFLSSYFTLYLPMKNLIWNYLTPLMVEQRTFASFKVANEKDLSQWDDICAVCLERMSKARITPCNHLFHPQCLKRCLQTSMQCPLCKNEFDTGMNNNRYFINRRLN
ncbi:E3 ubiquitin-protein ligase hrd-like protein 1 isoform X2 [Atheta coriaria]|uniref:E3 ubiquitin-protein ligase hrd-like protein 1 isoform X2 n=1 Tax=Dalotia coriaria TaxID=877792 RepID=UPI0031F3DB03